MAHRGKPYPVEWRTLIWGGDMIRPWAPPQIVLVSVQAWYGDIAHPTVHDDIECPWIEEPPGTFEAEWRSANISVDVEFVQIGVRATIDSTLGSVAWQWELWIDDTRQLSIPKYAFPTPTANFAVGDAIVASTPGGTPPALVPVGVIEYVGKRY